MAIALTDENAGELLQPIFDAASKSMTEQVTSILDKSEARMKTLEKAVLPEKVEIDMTDPKAVAAHLKTLTQENKSDVDMNDEAAVETHLKALKKANKEKKNGEDKENKEESSLETENAQLKRDLAKARLTSNLRQPSTEVSVEGLDMDDDEAFALSVCDDLELEKVE